MQIYMGRTIYQVSGGQIMTLAMACTSACSGYRVVLKI